ncbi:tripartite tricarboxylate transporter substrate binding protein (plasmid) [Cupriavidus pinatubonensis]|uniref:Bug family tripartite tricarboxylate transporter substrate binding protein n=1 Tax=Cupriavidus pinatubonensis TaxID=248026 RepID=UPI001C72ED10|nr:tripartite tricarboxylate transporter substrate binding protein [Cupriavidus pinatubonensis]QYY33795.1 tripartite tricarboxylate transporter substrate binding protein [Cupriavidus pinatubonensis]
MKRILIGASMVALLVAGGYSGLSMAKESWPSRPVQIVTPFPAGGGTDMIARAVAAKLQEQFGQSFIVDNRPGASGIIGTMIVKKAAPDGYQLGLGVTNTHAINQSFFKNLSYDPQKDFQPISLLAKGPHVIVINSKTPAKTLKEYLAWAKTQHGKLSYASYGNGSTAHLISEMLNAQNHLDMVHTPYKGIPPAVTDLLSEQVNMLVSTTSAVLPYVKAGKLRALAIIGESRVPSLPDVPTMKELGFNDYTYSHWYGLYAPAGTPRPIIEKIAGAVQRALASKEIQDAFENAGVTPAFLGPDEFKAFTRNEAARWAELVRLSGAKTD